MQESPIKLGPIQASGKVEEKWRKSGGKVEENGGKVEKSGGKKWRKSEGKVEEKWFIYENFKNFFYRLKGRTNSTRKSSFSSTFCVKNFIKLINFKKIKFFPPLFPLA